MQNILSGHTLWLCNGDGAGNAACKFPAWKSPKGEALKQGGELCAQQGWCKTVSCPFQAINLLQLQMSNTKQPACHLPPALHSQCQAQHPQHPAPQSPGCWELGWQLPHHCHPCSLPSQVPQQLSQLFSAKKLINEVKKEEEEQAEWSVLGDSTARRSRRVLSAYLRIGSHQGMAIWKITGRKG